MANRSKKERITKRKIHAEIHKAEQERTDHFLRGESYTSEELRDLVKKQDELLNEARKVEHPRLRSRQTTTLKKIIGDNKLLRSAVGDLMLSKTPGEVVARSIRQMVNINHFARSPGLSDNTRQRAIEAMEKIPRLAELINEIKETKNAPKLDALMRAELEKRIKILEEQEKKQLEKERK